MKYTTTDFAALTNKTESAILAKAFELFQATWAMGYEEVAQPILDEESVMIGMKMSHAFGVAVISALDVIDKTEDAIYVLVEDDLTFYLNLPTRTQ